MADSGLNSLAAINPVVSKLVVGVKPGANLIAEQVMPPVLVPAETFTYRVSNNEYLTANGPQQTLRAVGTDANKIGLTFGTATGQLDEHMLKAEIDYREIEAAQALGPESEINLRVKYAAALNVGVQLGKESAVAGVAFNAANYAGRTAAGTSFAGTGIRALVLQRKDERANDSGQMPNTLVLGQTAYRKLVENPDVKDAIKYTQFGAPLLDTLAAYFDVDKVLVGRAITQTVSATPGTPGTSSLLWTTDSAALMYVNDNPGASDLEPSFGYLFTMNYAETGVRAIVREQVLGLLDHLWYGERFRPVATFTSSSYLWTAVI